MITYSDLFDFVIMLAAIVTLVYKITKNNRPSGQGLRLFFYNSYLG